MAKNDEIKIYNLPRLEFNRTMLVKTNYVNRLEEVVSEISRILKEATPMPSNSTVYLLATALYFPQLSNSVDVRIWKYPGETYYITSSVTGLGNVHPSETVYEILEVNKLIADYNIDEHKRVGAPVIRVVGDQEVEQAILNLLTGSNITIAVKARAGVANGGPVSSKPLVDLVYEERNGAVQTVISAASNGTAMKYTGNCIEDLWRGCMNGGCRVDGEEIIIYGAPLKKVRGRGTMYLCQYEESFGECNKYEVELGEGGESKECIN